MEVTRAAKEGSGTPPVRASSMAHWIQLLGDALKLMLETQINSLSAALEWGWEGPDPVRGTAGGQVGRVRSSIVSSSLFACRARPNGNRTGAQASHPARNEKAAARAAAWGPCRLCWPVRRPGACCAGGKAWRCPKVVLLGKASSNAGSPSCLWAEGPSSRSGPGSQPLWAVKGGENVYYRG